MKPKLFIPGIVLAVTVISGCAANDNAMDERNENISELDPARELQAPADDELNNRLGYVRYTKDQLNNDAERNHAVTMDRTQMANMITRIILRNDGFNEVATLVTDEEVLIAYDKNEDIDEDIAADIAKKTAVSVMPEFFDVYVSDNDTLIRDIHSLHNSTTTNKNYDNTIDSIIDEMKNSSQGKDSEEG
ncbi:YhcN/YlaJ family sporulation lipoprotein [Virgibacillus indicus]|nr:YhcN/YlaJ family sporulation lipoprotein [Virgibacillus indicus]